MVICVSVCLFCGSPVHGCLLVPRRSGEQLLELLQAIRESHTHDDQPLRLKLQVVGV